MPATRDDCELQAGLLIVLLVLLVTADLAEDWQAITAGALTAIGWRRGYGAPLNSSAAFHAAWSAHSVLRRIGAFASDTGSRLREVKPSRESVSFARAALLTWPAARSRS